jgi:hypothetical protein
MGKGKRMRQQRRAEPTAVARDDNPWRERMIPAYMETSEWAARDPDLAEQVKATSEVDAGAWVEIIAEGEGSGDRKLSSEVATALQRSTARLLRHWAVLNGIVWLHDWPEPVSVMSDDEIVAAIRAERT